MPEHVQTNIDAKAADDECELATVVSYNGRFAFARLDRDGKDVFIGGAELARAGIPRLEIGARVSFEVRKSTGNRKPWAWKIRVVSEPTA
jgi:cold shock CspA family protein